MVEEHFTRFSFSKNYSNPNLKLDTSIFLNCVLNDQFTDICIRNPEIGKLNQILNVVFKKSPTIHTLDVNYFHNAFWTTQSSIQEIVHSNHTEFLLTLQKFKHLTSWQLDFLPKDCSPLLCKLGTNCPQLIHLSLGSFFFENKHAFALILGEGARLFPLQEQLDWDSERNCTHELAFAPSCLTPICKTLKSLEITHQNYSREKMCSAVFSLRGNPQSTLGFALCHLRKLEEVKQEQPYDLLAAYAVETLHRQSMIQFCCSKERFVGLLFKGEH